MASIGQSVATGLSLVVAALWVYFRYIRSAEHRANVGMECEIDILTSQRDHFVLEVVAAVSNRGKVPYQIRDLDLTLLGRKAGDEVEYSMASDRNHLRFRHELYEGSLLGKNSISVVDPGVTVKYRQVIAAPNDMQIVFAMLHLKAPGSGLERFVAERTKVLALASPPGDG